MVAPRLLADRCRLGPPRLSKAGATARAVTMAAAAYFARTAAARLAGRPTVAAALKPRAASVLVRTAPPSREVWRRCRLTKPYSSPLGWCCWPAKTRAVATTAVPRAEPAQVPAFAPTTISSEDIESGKGACIVGALP